jgi:hypothetical protein
VFVEVDDGVEQGRHPLSGSKINNCNNPLFHKLRVEEGDEGGDDDVFVEVDDGVEAG